MTGRTTLIVVSAALVIGTRPARAQHMGSVPHGDEHGVLEEHHEAPASRSPGLAAGLSLTPVPVDFGNLYAENVGWGIAYTSLELGLMAPMFFIAADHGMGHSGTANPWSSRDRNWMIGLVSGYVAVKIVSALHAAHAAEVFNRDQRARFAASIVPSAGGATAVMALNF